MYAIPWIVGQNSPRVFMKLQPGERAILATFTTPASGRRCLSIGARNDGEGDFHHFEIQDASGAVVNGSGRVGKSVSIFMGVGPEVRSSFGNQVTILGLQPSTDYTVVIRPSGPRGEIVAGRFPIELYADSKNAR